jgi:hypothetical protein
MRKVVSRVLSAAQYCARRQKIFRRLTAQFFTALFAAEQIECHRQCKPRDVYISGVTTLSTRTKRKPRYSKLGGQRLVGDE